MEGDAGASRLNSDSPSAPPEVMAEDSAESEGGADQTGAAVTPEPRPSRLSGRAVIGIGAVLVLLAAGLATGGYFGLRYHRESQAIAGDNAAAIAAAEDCVAATQAPDVAALAAAERKIIECSTGDFGAQAALYSGVLMQAYQAANVHVQLSEMRVAIERDNGDGSIDLLVALRTKVDNIEAQGQEHGYRLRVKMAREDGQYKIAKLDQVAK
jgi:Mce-associated membrane protein